MILFRHGSGLTPSSEHVHINKVCLYVPYSVPRELYIVCCYPSGSRCLPNHHWVDIGGVNSANTTIPPLMIRPAYAYIGRYVPRGRRDPQARLDSNS